MLCKSTYEYIVDNFPWVSITPSLHKLLAHSTELVDKYNNGYGLKLYSEECIEALNKHIRQYRDKLSRKTSFNDNVTDIFARLITQSDTILLMVRRNCHTKIQSKSNIHLSKELSQQDLLVNSLIVYDVGSDNCL